ncbi:hypothetical protein [Arthrobacter sp. SAFR-014]|uniref:hypothetical protein n=1 Tax=Arthrobacter sp. SAFR-014 TaxID=3387280 RepID=UPI003F7BE038
MWVLLVLLLAGAASYTHGSRYAIVGQSPFQTVAAQSAGTGWVETVARPAADLPLPGGAPASASQAVRAVQQAGQVVDPESVERDCCGRRHAPRGEPAPLRTRAVDPPSLLQWLPGDAGLSRGVPQGPDLPALTVLQLSISRT